MQNALRLTDALAALLGIEDRLTRIMVVPNRHRKRCPSAMLSSVLEARAIHRTVVHSQHRLLVIGHRLQHSAM